MRRSAARWAAFVTAVAMLCFGGAAIARSQGGRTPATLDHLLAEIKGLRSDLQESSSANLRVQTLVVRVTLQEQRLKALSEQLNAAQAQAAAFAEQRRDAERQLRVLDASPPTPSMSAADVRTMLDQFKNRVADFEKREDEAQSRVSELAGLVSAEQARWVDFNVRLDALESTLGRPR
jgi:chromosome segregation ATPase